MKKIILSVSILLSLIVLVSFSNSNPPVSEGKIGDVKYSILEPKKFIALHGKGWVLMDGRNINNSDLYKLTRMSMLPDARGVFLRAMNVDRDISEGDPEGKTRIIGSYQKDEIGKHTHKYFDSYFSEFNGPFGNERLRGNYGDSDEDNGRFGQNQTTESNGGDESRPRNIALYLYAKIDNQ